MPSGSEAQREMSSSATCGAASCTAMDSAVGGSAPMVESAVGGSRQMDSAGVGSRSAICVKVSSSTSSMIGSSMECRQ